MNLTASGRVEALARCSHGWFDPPYATWPVRNSVNGHFIDLEIGVGRSDGIDELEIAGPALILVRSSGVPVGSAFIPPGSTASGHLDEVVEHRHGPPLAPATGSQVRVAIAVCTRNRPELLRRCLQAVQRAVELAGHEVDASLIVIDNASDDERTAEAGTELGIDVRREPVPGLNVARNRAVAASDSDVVAFVDDDVVVEPTWLRTLARTFQQYPDAVAVTGGVLAHSLATEAQVEFEGCGGFFKGWRAGPVDWRDLPFDASIGVGCNMAFRRSALAETGPFDEALDTGPPLAGGGDLDILTRMAMIGTVVYEPSAMVRHEHRLNMEALGAQYSSWGKSWGAVLHKWYRRSPGDRPRIRRAVRRTLRWYGHDLIVPRSPGHLRHQDALRMFVGFLSGLTVSYPRSRRRMAQRRDRMS